MRKIDRFLLSAAAVIVLSLCSVAADAHEFWINAKAPEGGVLKADIGFGHGFPDPEIKDVSEKEELLSAEEYEAFLKTLDE